MVVNGETAPNKMKCKTQRTTENPKQTLKFGLGVLHIPMTQETANDIISTARVAVFGAQGPKITVPKPLSEILTGTVAMHCFSKIYSSHS